MGKTTVDETVTGVMHMNICIRELQKQANESIACSAVFSVESRPTLPREFRVGSTATLPIIINRCWPYLSAVFRSRADLPTLTTQAAHTKLELEAGR